MTASDKETAIRHINELLAFLQQLTLEPEPNVSDVIAIVGTTIHLQAKTKDLAKLLIKLEGDDQP